MTLTEKLKSRPAYKPSFQPPPAESATTNGHAPPDAPPDLKAGKHKPLTVRNVEEIMNFEPDENDLVLANGYLCKGDRTTLLGQGGLGKSRLSIQLAISCILGRDFLGIETRGEGLRWLFLQTENGMRRLRFDLDHMRLAYSPQDWDRVKDALFFHTLEGDEDGIILLDEPEHFARAEELILRVGADVIVCDPLRDTHGGDLNSDADMTAATRNLARLAKVGGRTDRCLLVLHHSLTGKGGAAKATGFDRSSFGRNSKVLQGWTRAQINVAPGNPDNSDVLVISSGKNNNFREFETFAVGLDGRTMCYHLKPDFNLEEWAASVSGQKRGLKNAGSDDVEEILRAAGGRMEKKILIERTRAKTGRGVQHIRNVLRTMAEESRITDVAESRHKAPAAIFVQLVDGELDDED